MTRADQVGWMADAIRPEAGQVWDQATVAFTTVMGRAPCERWDAMQPADAEVEDALVCWDIDLMVGAMLAAGVSQTHIDNG